MFNDSLHLQRQARFLIDAHLAIVGGMNESAASDTVTARRYFSGLQVLGTALLVILCAVVLTLGLVAWQLFPRDFTPVNLGAAEQQVLNAKLDRLNALADGGAVKGDASLPDRLPLPEPERYSEAGAARDVRLTEKELNALLATNTDLARKLAIDLSDGMVSARLLVPMDADFPLLGGKTLRLSAGLALDYLHDRPVVALKGVSVMGVPLPNAWLGGLKNIDLVNEFGVSNGFWRSLADGIEHIRVEEGQLTFRLRE